MSEQSDTTLLATKEVIDAICRQACVVPMDGAQAVLNELGRMSAIMPFTDPTGYMKIGSNLRDHEAALRAFMTFRAALEKLRPKVPA